ncbi:hypothetical protein ERX46_13885 [Brumimicrobium glaciale]|uniref:Lipoprotein n=1 Tax=Brumimicrobium glaciale TaxID=200475 RepID=A0A4Q4KHP3_9FLAO|nr:hypothetical protein [Brumimicrobium glaciale]RYM32368.1 hypothetical protein ERX46_13885 [Brumimicrobium glaciale]
MKYNLIALLVIVLTATSCAPIRKNHAKRLNTENRTDVKSKYNDDNIILITGKEFSYKVVQKDKDRTLNFDLALKVIPGNYSFGTKIKYKHYYSEAFLTEEEKKLFVDTVKFYKWDITSAHENTAEFHLHPPRSYTLTKLEIAPFPEINLPVIKGYKWSTINNIVAGYGEHNMNEVFRELIIEDVIYNADSSFVAKISGSSNWGKEISENKICNVEFEFNSKLGFTKMAYFFTDETSVVLMMEK